LRNGEIAVSFLSEGEINKNAFEEEKDAILEKQKSLGGHFNEADVKGLMDLGFTKPQVEEALSICDNNKEHAATYLMNQQTAQSPKR
jgi:Holliday junction resolvasome RuvABC DNA-binding subunit